MLDRVYTSPLPYVGGKRWLVWDLLQCIPAGIKKVVSPFGGGMVFELNAALRRYEVKAYDIDINVTNFWQQWLRHAVDLDYTAKLFIKAHSRDELRQLKKDRVMSVETLAFPKVNGFVNASWFYAFTHLGFANQWQGDYVKHTYLENGIIRYDKRAERIKEAEARHHDDSDRVTSAAERLNLPENESETVSDQYFLFSGNLANVSSNREKSSTGDPESTEARHHDDSDRVTSAGDRSDKHFLFASDNNGARGDVHNRLDLSGYSHIGLSVERVDFREVLPSVMSDTFLYCDPPYYGSENLYRGGKGFDHQRLARELEAVACPFVVSYNDHRWVRETYQNYRILPVRRPKGLRSNTDERDELLIVSDDIQLPAVQEGFDL